MKAKSLALDIDQDGIPNEKDIFPYINNYYIYAGIGILIIVVILASIGLVILLYKKRGDIKL